jgi:hypothetical protein
MGCVLRISVAALLCGALASSVWHASAQVSHAVAARVAVTNDLALHKTAIESSAYQGALPTEDALRAVDGNTDGNYFHNSVAVTNVQTAPWWRVDLLKQANITSIEIWGRTDCCSERLANYYVFVSPTPFSSAAVSSTLRQPGVVAHLITAQAHNPMVVTFNATGRYVMIQLQGRNWLQLAEVVVHGSWYVPPHQTGVVTPLYPTGKAGLPRNKPVQFAWKPFKGAANYLLHLWLVKQVGSTVIGPTTPVTLSVLVHGKTAYMWNVRGVLPGTYSYSLLPEDAYGNALTPWSPAVQNTILGS